MADPVPIHDNHFHCKPDGWKGMDAVREFAAAGGTSIAHVRLPAYSPDVVDFTKTVDDHLAYSQKIRTDTDVNVWSAIGPYPLEPLKIAEAEGWPAALEYGKACLDACRPYFAEGQAHCLGEVGRPHFEVAAEAWDYSNQILQYAMTVAKESNVPIMLHTEHADPDTMLEFAQMADKAGLPRERVIKHYCGPLVGAELDHGLLPSIIAGRSNIRKALALGDRFLLETDYIDEPTRPNVVMPCDTVPKRVMGLLQNGDMSDELAHRIGHDLPTALYG